MSIPKIVDELQVRIAAELAFYKGTMPERTAIAWRGYLAALLEWQLIPLPHYDLLLESVPDVSDDPVVSILTGRE